MVSDSSQCSVFLFFAFLSRCTFTNQVHMVLLFLTKSCVRDWTWETGGPSLTCLIHFVFSTKQMQNAEFTGQKSAIGRMLASESLSVPSFKH